MRDLDSMVGNLETSSVVEKALRISVAACFVGHGAFGFITKAAWVPYFSIVGIPEDLAWQLMPVVGAIDIITGLLILLIPTRAALYWALAWTVWTALARPLSGEPWFEFLERAGNYGVPLAWLLAVGCSGPLISRLPSPWPLMTEPDWRRVAWILRLTTAALLAGHAGFGLFMQKPILATHYSVIVGEHSAAILPWMGGLELLLALLVLLRPTPALLIGVLLYKVFSELLYPITGSPLWEFIERFGSYMAPFALAIILSATRSKSPLLQPTSSDKLRYPHAQP